MKLLDFFCYWCLFSFFITPLSESPCYYFETISSCWTRYGTDICFLFCQRTVRFDVLLEIETKSSCWTRYCTDISFPFLSTHCQIRRVIRIWNNIKLLDLVWYWFFFCILNLTEQLESPCYQTLKQYEVAGLGMVPCYQTLKQYQVAGFGMLLIFIFLFCHPTIRVAVLLELETISSCWTWYCTDISFPFYHRTIRVALLLEFETISSCWTWYGTDVSFPFFITPLWESPCY